LADKQKTNTQTGITENNTTLAARVINGNKQQRVATGNQPYPPKAGEGILESFVQQMP